MDKNKLQEIRELIELVMHARTKKEAKPLSNKLDFAVIYAQSTLDPYFAGKLREAANYAKEASGQVKNKSHWISCMESSWYVLSSHILYSEVKASVKN